MSGSYLVIGGNPFRMYTGTTTFTGLRKIGEYSSYGQAEKAVLENFDECGGLIEIFTAGDEKCTEDSLTSSISLSKKTS